MPVPPTLTPTTDLPPPEPTITSTPEPTVTPTYTATPPNTGLVQVQKFYCPAGEDGERTQFFDEPEGNAQLAESAGCSQNDAAFSLVAEDGSNSGPGAFTTGTDGQYQVTVPEGMYVLTETDPDMPGSSSVRVAISWGQITTVIVINYVVEPPPTVISEPTASPPSTLASEGEVAYAENFDDPEKSRIGTDSSDPEIYRYRFEAGEYVIERVEIEADGVPARYLPGTYRDVTVAVDARLVGEMEDRYVFLTCRDDPEATEGTQYRFSVEPSDMYFGLSRWEDGEQTILVSGVREDAIEPGEAVNRLQLSCVGTELTAWVNGVEVARVEDDTLTEGRAKIGTGDYANQLPGTVEARFDNLEVRVRQVMSTPVAGEVAYADDFDDPEASHFRTEDNDSANHQYRFDSGEYVMEKIEPEAGGTSAQYLRGSYRDVTVAVDARLVGETEDRYVFLTCRDDPEATEDTHYRFSVEPSDMYFRLTLWEAGEETILADGVREDAIAPDDEVNHLQIRCIGNEISTVINGVEVAQVENAALAEGGAWIGTGIYTNSLPGTVEARFDNLEVTEVNDSASNSQASTASCVPFSRVRNTRGRRS